jgi:Flp pilus assembly protein TadD
MTKEEGLLASGRVTLPRMAAAMAVGLAITMLLPGCSFMRDYRSRVHSEEAFARGAKAAEHHDFAAADENFAEALRAEPNSASLYARIGLAYMSRPVLAYAQIDAAQANRALPCLRRAIELNPKQPILVYLEAIFAALRLEREDEARSFLSQSADVFHKDAMALNDIGYLLADSDKLTSDALPLLERAVELQPKVGNIIDSLGWAHYRLRHLDRAAALLARACHLAPNEPELEYHLGVVYADLGRTEDAKKQFRRALEINRTFFPARAALHSLERQ